MARQSRGTEIHQVLVVHLSDVHFGSGHAFNSTLGPDGTPLSSQGIPSFAELLMQDLAEPDPGCPVVVAITGDMSTKCEDAGFQEAATFLRSFDTATVFGKSRGIEGVFVVPGNHDINSPQSDTHL